MKAAFNSRAALGLALVVLAGGCDNFLEVKQPTAIDAGTIDPVVDAPTFSLSAQGNLFNALDNLVVYSAWFTGEAYVGDSFTQRTEVARREVTLSNSLLNSEVYGPLSLAVASSERVLELLKGTANADASVEVARAALSAGYSIELMAETFCQGVVSTGLQNLGSAQTPEQLSARAVERFRQAIEVGTAAGSAAGAADIVNAARVGLARAYLQLGKYQAAVDAAAGVPAGFVYNATRSDADSRLGNFVHDVTAGRRSLVVPPYFRALNDRRVGSELEIKNAATGEPWTSQWGGLPFYKQTKYPSYKAPLRLASGLEARYIAAEARLKLNDESAARALVAERAAQGGPSATGVDGGAPLLRQLLDQKSRDFYLEGVHMGDWRRNPQDTPYVPAAGTAFYVAGVQPIGTQTCLPVPEAEQVNNPNF